VQLHRLIYIGKWTKFFAKLLSKSNNLCGSGSGRIFALPLPQKKDRFQLPLPHPRFQVDLDKLQNDLWYCYEKQSWWRWCKHTPQNFVLLKIWATSLNICAKMTPNVAWLQKLVPKVCRKTHEDVFGHHTKKSLNDLCWREFVDKSCTKNFSGSLGKFGEKSFAPQNFACT